MTATIASPLPHDTTLLPMPSAAEVVTLQQAHGYPLVSVLCRTEPGCIMGAGAAARLARLVMQACDRLDSELGAADAASLRDRLEALSRDAMTRPTRDGVALYVGESHASAWALPVAVLDRAVVDPTFATRDLVRALHRTPRHVVLVLTDREARLFDGVGDTLLPAVTGPFPLVGARPPRAGRPSPATSRSRVTEVDDEGEAFLRTVDRALGTYLRLHPAPLVLVGAPRTTARFRHLSRNVGRLAGTISGSHARTTLPVLTRLIRPVLDQYLHSRQAEALALLDQRVGAGQVVTGIRAVWLAARADRPEMLAVEESLFYPARVTDDGDFLDPATDVQHPDVIDDAVDEVIEIVLRRGGWIALVEDGALAAYDRIALSVGRR